MVQQGGALTQGLDSPQQFLEVLYGMQVWLCKEVKSGKIVALKKLDKAEMIRRGQIDHVKAERDVLAGIQNPFIVKLFYSFQVPLSRLHCKSLNGCGIGAWRLHAHRISAWMYLGIPKTDAQLANTFLA